MDLLIIAAIFFVIALVVRRKEAFQFRWLPTRHTWVAVGTGLLVHGAVMFTFALVLQLFRDEILAFFSSDPEVIRIGSEYLWFLSLNFMLWAFYFVFLRSLQGAGDFLVPMAISLGAALLVALPLAWALARHTSLGPTGIWTAQLASSVVVTTGTAIWMATGRWTRRAAQSKGE